MKGLISLVAFILLTALPAFSQQPGYPTRGNVTRMDIQPSEFQQNRTEVRTETEFGACVSGGIGAAGAKVCVSEGGTISVGANLFGGQATIYGNPQTGNMGGCVGVGGTVGAVAGASASAVVCGDRNEGLVGKTSVGTIVGEATTTYYNSNR